MDYIILGLLIAVFLTAIIVIVIVIKRTKNTNNDKNDNSKEIVLLNEKINKNLSDFRVDIANDINKTNSSNNSNFSLLSNNLIDKINNSNTLNQKEFGSLKNDISNYLNSSISKIIEDNELRHNKLSESLIQNINLRIDSIDKKVDDKLSEGFKNSNETFTKVIEQLTKIDSAQKNIEKLGTDVVSLKDILANKKQRGIYGETALYQILSSVYGDNDKLYSKQYKLDYKVDGSDVVPDAVIHCPSPINDLCIDSKFPLENYQNMYNNAYNDAEKDGYRKAFRLDIEKHIKDISKKYIKKDTTAELALMFIPSEGIFAEINSNFPELVEKANNSKVWLTSPTTLLAVTVLVNTAARNIELNKNAKVVKTSLDELAKQFDFFGKRWEKLVTNVNNLADATKDISTTSQKIQKQFDKIKEVDILDLENKEVIGNKNN
ncbi:MAG: DNA recombination protein RmuC [Acholeplasmatales bacterium]|jgi:DNA recombination protein RmuC|nr:DNA recombination protein RmuC [Acholeplasmatales bacterium]